MTYPAGSGANVLELRRPPWQEVRWRGVVIDGGLWPSVTRCAIPRLAGLSPRCMQVAVGMQQPPVTYPASSGVNVPELRRPPWQEVGWRGVVIDGGLWPGLSSEDSF